MIPRRTGHIAASLLAAACCASCDSIFEHGGGTPGPAEVDPRVNLTFTMATADPADPDMLSRAIVTEIDSDNYFEVEASVYERVHSLRIIILRPSPDGGDAMTVEHNRLFTMSPQGVVRYDDMTFRVMPDENKKVYLLANEQDVAFDFGAPGLQPGDTYVPGTLENVTYSADPSSRILVDNSAGSSDRQYIPMAEVHDVYVAQPDGESPWYQDAGPLFVTRAAVKFSFEVTGGPDINPGLYVSDITFSSLADKEYYLPRNTVYSPAKGTRPEATGRFITSYDVPADVTYSPCTFTLAGGIPVERGVTHTTDLPLYFCESKFGFAGPDGTPYTVGISLAARDSSGAVIDSTAVSTPVRALPNLPILPRNTHVIVRMTVNSRSDIDCTVDAAPYTGKWLNPDFGFENLLPGDHEKPSDW